MIFVLLVSVVLADDQPIPPPVQPGMEGQLGIGQPGFNGQLPGQIGGVQPVIGGIGVPTLPTLPTLPSLPTLPTIPPPGVAPGGVIGQPGVVGGINVPQPGI